MTPERYHRIDELFLAALEREPRLRAAFLDEACAGDPELRKEVEVLLDFNQQGLSIIDTPASEIFAGLFGDRQPELTAGQQVDHYTILSLIGRGGMGEVYLAQDRKLGRKAALKLLPADATREGSRVNRFRQEARAASALNHPNIVTIYEVGQINDRHFIAAEFIKGETLRQLMKHSQLDLHRVLNIAVQVVEALTAAHEAGIVHRDIKPENIMVRPDGYVKVLDFGLAKLIEQQPSLADTQGSTVEQLDTQPGLILGTVNYMSPEQARGQAVDARSDLFSFGVVVYEMVVGRPPFEGETTSDVIAAILTMEPPLAQYAPGLPPEMQRIIGKALRKDKGERYQSARDLLVDLKALKQEMDLQSKVKWAIRSGGSGGSAVATSEPEAVVQTVNHMARSTADVAPIRTASLAEYITGQVERHRARAALVVILLLAVAGLTGFGIYKLINRYNASSGPKNIRTSRISTTGKAGGAAISPDGRYVAYLNTENGQQSLWVRQVAAASSVQVIPPSPIFYSGLTFSPDGNYLYYAAKEKNDPAPTLYQMPTFGGTSIKLIAGVNPVALSPDGKHLAFVRETSQTETAVIVANADGSQERQLAARQPPYFFASVAWSPDGKRLACVGFTEGYSITELEVNSGAEKAIVQGWDSIDKAIWLADGSGLYLVAMDRPESTNQIWQIAYPDGTPLRITTDLNNYFGLSATANSSAVVTTQSISNINFWIQSYGGDPGEITQLTFGSGRMDGWSGFAWTPDGKIVFSSAANGHPDIWIMDKDGSNQRQLTVNLGSNTYGLSVSPDGRYIVFVSGRAGGFHIWRVDIDGGNPKQLTDGTGELNPFFSPDGQWVFYHYGSPDKPGYWKVSVEGGNPVQLPAPLFRMIPNGISPDGKMVACSVPGDPTKEGKLDIVSAADGALIKQLPISRNAARVQWTPDGRALTYFDTRGGVSNVWTQPLNGAPAKPLTDFKTDRIHQFAWSPDGKWLLCNRGANNNDVVLISDIK